MVAVHGQERRDIEGRSGGRRVGGGALFVCVRAATAGIEGVGYSGGEGGLSGPGYPAHGDEISFVRGEVGEFVLELVDEMGDLFFHGSGGGEAGLYVQVR